MGWWQESPKPSPLESLIWCCVRKTLYSGMTLLNPLARRDLPCVRDLRISAPRTLHSRAMRIRFRPCHCLAVSVALATAPAFGAEKTAAPDTADLYTLSIEELLSVKVTVASLFATDDLHSPSNVSVISEADWQQSGARETNDALTRLPATQILPLSFGYDAIAMRGYAQTTSTRGIATSVDGVRLNNFSFGTGQSDTPNFNLGVLNRIEVIRGPASAVYGSDAFHGVIAMHAFESTTDSQQASAEWGDKGFYKTAARLSGRLTEPLRFNIAVAGSGQGDQDRRYEDTLGGDIDKTQRYQSRSMSMKLVSDPGRDLSVRWGVYADEYAAKDFPSILATYETGQTTGTYFTRLAATQILSDIKTLEAAAYHRTSNVDRLARLSPTQSVVAAENHFEETASGVALTLRQPFSAQNNTQWALALGYDTEYFNEGATTQYYAAAPTLEVELGGVGQTREITSLIYDADTRFGEGEWGIVYGGRWDHYSDFGAQLSPRAGLILTMQQNTAIKLLYGRAFRAPSAAELYFVPAGSAGSTGSTDLSPETLDSLDLVFMRQFARWQTNVVLFANRWRNGIVLTPQSEVLSTYVNSGRNEARGIEYGLVWLPDVWRVEFNASYTQSRNLTQDRDYTLFPDVMANLLIGYEFEPAATRITVSNRYSSRADDIPALGYNAPDTLPAYWRTDVNVTKTLDPALEVFLNVQNLFNRDNRIPSVLGIEGGMVDDPLGASVGVKFGF